MRKVALLALLSALAGHVSADAADEAQAYGRRLARGCTSCHRPDGRGSAGIPPIAGWELAALIASMRAYQDGSRTDTVMVSVARALDAAQLQALAAYWASLPEPASKK